MPFIQEIHTRIHQRLAEALEQPIIHSEKLKKALKYSVLNNGKRVRPLLTYLTGTSFGASLDALDHAACAIELIHCYSLVHDDLPAMDNATLRRGEPTCHKAFDEATAILVGDALQPLAFELLANNPHASPQQRLDMILLLAQASGAAGMVDGQALDIELSKTPSIENLERLYARKTGALIHASITLGGIAAGLSDIHLDHFAHDIGLAFQIVDDLLDIEGDPTLTGKDVGLDQQNEKNTYPLVVGINAAKQKVKTLTAAAFDHLHQIQGNTELLKKFAETLVLRTH